MKKFEAGKIYYQTDKFNNDKISKIYVHSANKMLIYSHISYNGKMWAFSKSGKDRVKIRGYDNDEYVYLPIGICGSFYEAKDEVNKSEV